MQLQARPRDFYGVKVIIVALALTVAFCSLLSGLL